ncbi:MAG: flagellar protein FlbB [Spirochaetota bacterium]
MAGYGIVGTGPRIIVLLLLIIALLFGGLIWFDFLGLIDVKDTLAPVLSLVGQKPRTKIADIESPVLLGEERMKKQLEALELRTEELDKREEQITLTESEIKQMLESLKEKEKVLEEKEKAFNVQASLYENKRANIEQNSKYLVGMPPKSAVKILKNMEDQDVIDLLRATERLAAEAGEESIVAYWLSLLAEEEPARAATLQRKMAKKPEG